MEELGRQRSCCRLITLNPPISNLSSVNKCISQRVNDNATVDREGKILPAIYNDDISQLFKLASMKATNFGDKLPAAIYL